MFEFLIFAAIAASIAVLIWGKKLLPSKGVVGKMPPWGGRLAGSVVVVIVAAAIWWLIPWESTPPGKMLSENISKEAYEMMVWLLGVGLTIVTVWLVWKIFRIQNATARKPINGVWLVWILAIITAGITAYAIAEMKIKSDKEALESQQVYRTVNLVTKDSEMIEMMLTSIVMVSIPSINISEEGDKRAWICAKVVRPAKLPFEPEFTSVSGGYSDQHQVVLSEQSRQDLFDNGTLSVTVHFWREIAQNTDCK